MAAPQGEPSHGFVGGQMWSRVSQKPANGGPLYDDSLSFTHKEGRA